MSNAPSGSVANVADPICGETLLGRRAHGRCDGAAKRPVALVRLPLVAPHHGLSRTRELSSSADHRRCAARRLRSEQRRGALVAQACAAVPAAVARPTKRDRERPRGERPMSLVGCSSVARARETGLLATRHANASRSALRSTPLADELGGISPDLDESTRAELAGAWAVHRMAASSDA